MAERMLKLEDELGVPLPRTQALEGASHKLSYLSRVSVGLGVNASGPALTRNEVDAGRARANAGLRADAGSGRADAGRGPC